MYLQPLPYQYTGNRVLPIPKLTVDQQPFSCYHTGSCYLVIRLAAVILPS